jgi:hypothetical protein
MFLVLLIFISFDAIPTNFSGLFIPGLIAYNSEKSSSSKEEDEDNEGYSIKPLSRNF